MLTRHCRMIRALSSVLSLATKALTCATSAGARVDVSTTTRSTPLFRRWERTEATNSSNRNPPGPIRSVLQADSEVWGPFRGVTDRSQPAGPRSRVCRLTIGEQGHRAQQPAQFV